jgi:hypothetical protein
MSDLSLISIKNIWIDVKLGPKKVVFVNIRIVKWLFLNAFFRFSALVLRVYSNLLSI